MEPTAAGRHPLRHLDLLRKTAGQPIAPADHRESNAGALKTRAFDDEIPVEERHQAGDLSRWTLPVVCGERIQREHVDPECGRRLHHPADPPRALFVANQPRMAEGVSPAAVAVHDDRDVHHASRSVRCAKTAPQSTRAVACIITNSVRIAPTGTFSRGKPPKKNA